MRLRRLLATHLVILVIFPTLAASMACKHSDKAADCERLVPAVREKSEELRTILTNAQPSPEVMEAHAKTIEASGASIAALPLKDPATKSFALQYQLQLMAGAKLVRELGNVNPDPAAMAAAGRMQTRSSNLLIDDATLVTTIVEFCH